MLLSSLVKQLSDDRSLLIVQVTELSRLHDVPLGLQDARSLAHLARLSQLGVLGAARQLLRLRLSALSHAIGFFILREAFQSLHDYYVIMI